MGDEKPEIFVQLGHSGAVNSVIFSPDGKYVLSGDDKRTMKLWDVATGREIRTLTGHTGGINSVAFSPDGKYALSGSWDKTVKLWNVKTGEMIKSFKDNNDELILILSVNFSPDGRYVLAKGGKSIKLWDIKTGKESNLWGFYSLDYFSNGKYFLSKIFSPEKSSFTINLFDAYSGEKITSYYTDFKEIVSVISMDGKYRLSVSKDSSVFKLWEVFTGKEIRTFMGHLDKVNSVAFSPDGKHIVSSSDDRTIRFWDIETGKALRTIIVSREVFYITFSPDGKYVLSNGLDGIQLWDIITGREMRRYEGHVTSINSVAFSPDGKYSISGGSPKSMLWDLETGRGVKDFRRYETVTDSTAISNNGRYALLLSRPLSDFFSLDEFNNISEVDVLWKRIETDGYAPFIKSSKTNIDCLNELLNQPNFYDVWIQKNRHITLPEWVKKIVEITNDSRNKDILKLHIQKQREIRALNRKLLEITYPQNCPKSDYVELWNITTGEKIRTLKVNTEGGLFESVVFSPDDRYAIAGIFHAMQESIKKTIYIWDVKTGEEIISFADNDSAGSVAVSPDGKHILSRGRKTLKLWNIQTKKTIWTFKHDDEIVPIVFSPNGRHIAIGNNKNMIKLLDVETGRVIKTFSGHNSHVWSIAFSLNGKSILSGSWDQTVKMWDVESEEIRTFVGHSGEVMSVMFSPNGKYALSGSWDGTTRLWDIVTGKEILKLVVFKDGEWIVITPEGYYNSSPRGHEYLNIRVGNKVYGIDQFYDVFYRPNIVAAKLRGDDISSLITLTIDDAIKNPPPTVEFASVPSETDQSKVKVCYQVKSTGGGIGEVRLFHNGKLIESDGFYRDIAKLSAEKTQLANLNSKTIYEDMRGVIIKGKADTTPIVSKSKGEFFEDCKEVECVSGENEVSVTAFNNSNTVQSYMKTANFNANIKGEEPYLYILSIGIDQYEDSKVNLKYAVKDAKDMTQKLLRQSDTLFKPENIHHEMFIDKDATKANILNKINEISRKVKPVDSFILFVAGHGILLQNQYYMLTGEYDGNVNEGTMISSNEIVEMSKKIKSLSQLFIFDTCHAGGVDYIISGLYDARMSVLAKKMGLHIYASANSKEAAMDGYQENGLFTYTLLDGLNNNKNVDKNKDNKISLTELGEYSKTTTTDISKKIGHAQTPLTIDFGKDNPVYNLR